MCHLFHSANAVSNPIFYSQASSTFPFLRGLRADQLHCWIMLRDFEVVSECYTKGGLQSRNEWLFEWKQGQSDKEKRLSWSGSPFACPACQKSTSRPHEVHFGPLGTAHKALMHLQRKNRQSQITSTDDIALLSKARKCQVGRRSGLTGGVLSDVSNVWNQASPVTSWTITKWF